MVEVSVFAVGSGLAYGLLVGRGIAASPLESVAVLGFPAADARLAFMKA